MPALDHLNAATLEIAFFQVGGSTTLRPGFIHEKVQPFGIIAQATTGEYEIACQGRTSRTTAPEAFLTPANTPMRITHHGVGDRFEAHWVHFSFVLYQTLEVTSLLDMPLTLPAAPGEHVREIIQELRQPAESPPAGLSALAAAARERELAWLLLRLICEVSTPRPGALEQIQAGKRLEPLLEHLNAHLADPISVPQMAAIAQMSVSRFHAFFKARLASGPMEYLTHLRLKRAAALFTQAGNPLVKEVAAATGFATASHLSREFKRRYGVSPREFRERAV